MIRRQTLILLVIFAALLALVFYLQENPLPSEASTTPSPTPPVQVFNGLESGEVHGITLSAAEGDEIAVSRDTDGAWQLETEGQKVVDAGKVEQIRAQITAMRVMTFLPENTAADPGALGLNDPVYIIRVNRNNGQHYVVRVGNRIPTGSGYYAQVDNQAPIVINQYNIDTVVSLMDELLLAELTEESEIPAP